jgi:hypothetical protein
MADDPTHVFDRAAWHEAAARDAGGERPFAHGALYRRWLSERGLLLEEGADVGPIDELAAADLTDEGRAFSDAYYGRYLEDFGAVFADPGPYAVEPDDDTFARIARVIDQRYAEWVYAGRPELPPEDDPGEALAALLDDADLPPELTEEAIRSMSPDEVVVALERLIARGRRPG